MDEVKNYPPYLDYPKSYTASADEHKHKIKTSFARIIVEGTPTKPYYNIEYFDPTDKEYHIGFGSYYLDNVFNWFAEEFEITESHTDTDTDYISRAALLARYDAEHVGPPGRARELIATAPAADVVPVVHGELTERIRELLQAEQDGRLLVLPCKVGDRIYRVIDDCTFPGDCGTKRMCKGCEYRNLFIEKTTFRLYLLTDEGKLRRGYYRTREEAEKALEGNKNY